MFIRWPDSIISQCILRDPVDIDWTCDKNHNGMHRGSISIHARVYLLKSMWLCLPPRKTCGPLPYVNNIDNTGAEYFYMFLTMYEIGNEMIPPSIQLTLSIKVQA